MNSCAVNISEYAYKVLQKKRDEIVEYKVSISQLASKAIIEKYVEKTEVLPFKKAETEK